MFELFAFTTPNCWKASIMLEELGAEYSCRVVNLAQGEHKSSGYLAMNPVGKVPFLIDRANGERMFGSSTILMYLGEKSGRFLPTDGVARAETLDQLMFATTDLGVFNFYGMFTNVLPQRDDFAIGIFEGEIDRMCKVMDLRLKDREFLAGEYSIADMAAFPYLGGARRNEDLLSRFPNLTRWVDDVGRRDAVKRGLLVPDLTAVAAQ